MSVAIRLSRTGKVHSASYRITVQEKWSKLRGKYIENLGFFNPKKGEGERFKINRNRYDYWISKGAQPSQAVTELIEGNGKRPPRPKKQKREKEAPAPQAQTTQAPQTEAPTEALEAKTEEKPQTEAPAQQQAQSPAGPKND